jgi:hypothetical protein
MDNKHQHVATSFVPNCVLETHNIFGRNFQSHSLRKTINAATVNVKLKMVLTLETLKRQSACTKPL